MRGVVVLYPFGSFSGTFYDAGLQEIRKSVKIKERKVARNLLLPGFL
jgi:hypothetical protein